jgi:hypothetical protein
MVFCWVWNRYGAPGMRVRSVSIDQQLRDLTEKVRELRREIAEMVNHRETRPGWRRPEFRRAASVPTAVQQSADKNLDPKRRRR